MAQAAAFVNRRWISKKSSLRNRANWKAWTGKKNPWQFFVTFFWNDQVTLLKVKISDLNLGDKTVTAWITRYTFRGTNISHQTGKGKSSTQKCFWEGICDRCQELYLKPPSQLSEKKICRDTFHADWRYDDFSFAPQEAVIESLPSPHPQHGFHWIRLLIPSSKVT